MKGRKKVIESIRILLCSIFLLIYTIEDVKDKKVNIYVGSIFLVLGIFISIALKESMGKYVLAFIPGAFIIFISYISKGAIGIGDGIAGLVIGGLVGIENSIIIIFTGLLSSALWGGMMLMFFHRKKSDTIAFMPFLLIGNIVFVITRFFV